MHKSNQHSKLTAKSIDCRQIHLINTNNNNMKVITKSLQTSTSKPKRRSEASGDEEEHAISLPAQRVTTTEKNAIDAKSTLSEPVKVTGKKTDGSVSYTQHYSISI